MQRKGQQIRYLFDFVGLKHVDTRPSWEEWLEIKASEKYGKYAQLPQLINRKTGEAMNQSVAILRFLCAEAGLVPRMPLDQYEADFYFELKDEYDNIPNTDDGYWKEGASEEEIQFSVDKYS